MKIIILSRIARVKNLDIALKILSKVTANVVFDIYGPLEDPKYWTECQELINILPHNIMVHYRGIVTPDQIIPVFGCYDLFLLPTGGENYGHVIAESLTSGTPVLISDKTPWKNLQSNNFGWDIPLDKINLYIEIIENYAKMSLDQRSEKRSSIKAAIEKYLLDPIVLEANIQLFLDRAFPGK